MLDERRTPPRWCAVAAGLLTLFASPTAFTAGKGKPGGGSEPAYVVVDLGHLGVWSEAYALNDRGQVVGRSTIDCCWIDTPFVVNPEDTDGDGTPDLWARDTDGNGFNDLMINLGLPAGAVSGKAWSINNFGQVAGSISFGGRSHGFLVNPEDTDGDGAPDSWFRDSDADGINDLMIDLGEQPEWVSGINGRGWIVGTFRTTDGNRTRCGGLLLPGADLDGDGWPDYTPDGAIDIGDSPNDWPQGINASGQVILSRGQHFPRVITPDDVDGDGAPDTWWRDVDGDGANDLAVELPGLGNYTELYAITDAGKVAGYSQTRSRGPFHATVWEPDGAGGYTLTDLGRLASHDLTIARDVNDAGDVVGRGVKYDNKPSPGIAKLTAWVLRGGELVALFDLVADGSGFANRADSEALGVNSYGEIVGGAQTVAGGWNAFVALPLSSIP